MDLVGVMRTQGDDARAVALWAGGSPPLLDLPLLGRSAYGPRTLLRLRAAVPRGAVAVAHGSSTLAASAVALAGRAPFAYRSIGDPVYWGRSRSRRRRIGALLGRAAVVVVMWPEAAEDMRRLYGASVRRVVVIPKGISADVDPVTDAERAGCRLRLGIPAEHRVVACLGALSPEKDPGTAVRAVAALPDAHLVVIGGGPLRSELDDLARCLLPGRHTMVGALAEPRAALAAADALVLPSLSEGVPSAPLEAALLGIPSVVTGVGGAPTTVVDGTAGAVVAPRDPAATARALERVLAEAPAMGAMAREHVRSRFDIAVTAGAWRDLCDELAGDRASRHRK